MSFQNSKQVASDDDNDADDDDHDDGGDDDDVHDVDDNHHEDGKLGVLPFLIHTRQLVVTYNRFQHLAHLNKTCRHTNIAIVC